jgi:hypothetical protein
VEYSIPDRVSIQFKRLKTVTAPKTSRKEAAAPMIALEVKYRSHEPCFYQRILAVLAVALMIQTSCSYSQISSSIKYLALGISHAASQSGILEHWQDDR